MGKHAPSLPNFDVLLYRCSASILHTLLTNGKIENTYTIVGKGGQDSGIVLKVKTVKCGVVYLYCMRGFVYYHSLLHASIRSNPSVSHNATSLRSSIKGLHVTSVRSLGEERGLRVDGEGFWVECRGWSGGEVVWEGVKGGGRVGKKKRSKKKEDGGDKYVVGDGAKQDMVTSGAKGDEAGRGSDASAFEESEGDQAKPTFYPQAGKGKLIAQLLTPPSPFSRYSSPFVSYVVGLFSKREGVEIDVKAEVLEESQDLWAGFEHFFESIVKSVVEGGLGRGGSIDHSWLVYENLGVGGEEENVKFVAVASPYQISGGIREPGDFLGYLGKGMDARSRLENLLTYENVKGKNEDRMRALERNLNAKCNLLEFQSLHCSVSGWLCSRHSVIVKEVLGVIKMGIESGEKWKDMEELIDRQRRAGSPAARAVKQVQWEEGGVVIDWTGLEEEGIIARWELEEGEECKVDWSGFNKKERRTEVDLYESTLNAFHSVGGNVRSFYDKRAEARKKIEGVKENEGRAKKAAVRRNAKKEVEAKEKLKSVARGDRDRIKGEIGGMEERMKGVKWSISQEGYLWIWTENRQEMQKAFERYVNDGDVVLGNPDEEGWAFIIAKKKKDGETVRVGERVKEEVGSFVSTRWKGWGEKEIGRYWTAEVAECTLLDGDGRRVEAIRVLGKKEEGRGGLEVGIGVLFRTEDSRPWVEKEECYLWTRKGGKEADVGGKGWREGEEERKMNANSVPSAETSCVEDGTRGGAGDAEDATVKTPEALKKLEPTVLTAEPYFGKSKTSPSTPYPVTKKKGLSTHDRKMVKKYGSLEAAAEAKAKLAAAKKDQKLSKCASPGESGKETTGQTTTKRKKVSKKKQRKYDEQDEEDRKNAMIALHGKKTQLQVVATGERLSEEECTEAIHQETLSIISQLPPDVQAASNSLLAKVTIPTSSFSTIQTLDTQPSMLAALSRFGDILGSSGNPNPSDVGKSFMGVVRTIRKFGVEPAPRKDLSSGMDLSQRVPFDASPSLCHWTANPSSSDKILYAKIVLGNAHAMKSWKYKVKVVPGTGKRGKIIKGVRNFWTKGKHRGTEEERKLREREIECINGISEQEAADGCIGDVRVAEKGFK